jgi:hypothetical protein
VHAGGSFVHLFSWPIAVAAAAAAAHASDEQRNGGVQDSSGERGGSGSAEQHACSACTSAVAEDAAPYNADVGVA